MDKLIPVLNFLKKNKFWLACGFISAAMIGTWFFASMQLADQQSKAESNIESKINNAESIKSTTVEGAEDGVVAHPNDATIAGMEVELKEGVDAVLAAWEIRRKRQESLLVWPDEVKKNDLFTEFFEQYDPPETFPVEGINNMAIVPLLSIYKEGIPQRMDALCQIIGSRWKHAPSEDDEEEGDKSMDGDRPPGGAGPGLPPGMGGSGRDEGAGRGRGGRGGDRKVTTNLDEDDISIVVQWNEENQDLWQKKLTTFYGYDGNKMAVNAPTPLQVFMLQQDLWLLEAMFNIIKDVNGGATARDLAKIKRIDHIAFGREARAQLGELAKANKALATAGAAKSEKLGPGGRKRTAGGRNKKGPIDPFEKAGPDKYSSPFHGRYVTAEFAPITASDVRDVLSTDATKLPEKNLELVVAKRVPVRVAFRMDERTIPEFIYVASKHPFAFEVNQVRINKHVPGDGIVMAGSLSAAASASDGGRGDKPDRSESIGAAGGAGGAGMIGDGNENTKKESDDGPVETRSNYNVDVEFYGVVKIYNPVNRALLTGEKPESPANEGDDADKTTTP